MTTETDRLQALFDKALTGIRQQGGFAVNGTLGCAYRTRDGRKCAVGHLIPDEIYKPDMEGHGADVVWERVSPGATNKELCLVTKLQGAHDTSEFCGNMDSFESEMACIADSFGLTYTPPKEN